VLVGNMKVFFLLTLIALLAVDYGFWRVSAAAKEIELDSFGDSHSVDDVDDDGSEQGPKQVTMYNKYTDQTVSVFWEDVNTGNDVKLFEINPLEMVDVSTSLGHYFYALTSDSNERAHPYSVIIDRDVASYSFGPPKERRPQKAAPTLPIKSPGRRVDSGRHADIDRNYLKHPSIRPIGRHTTSMAAKFRCLVPKMDYWCPFFNTLYASLTRVML
jgi:hypothetical protein